jgi:ABC-2 type transport system permease protein
MSRFKTLLQREWMQHHRGWLIVMAAPALVALLVMLFADKSRITQHDPAPVMMVGVTFAVTALTYIVTCLVVFLQAPGTARRDQQDRSIEFWVSLPVAHTQSIGATVLMHLVLVPLLALGIGYLASQVLGFIAVLLVTGPSGLVAVPWGAVISGGLLTLLRVAFGVVLASLWIVPVLLLAMAASAWLKRWGVPVLIAAVVAGNVVLSKIYGITLIGDTLKALWINTWRSLIYGEPSGMDRHFKQAIEGGDWPVTPQWLAQDALASINNLAQPTFVFALLLGVGCFALLVLRRQRA